MILQPSALTDGHEYLPAPVDDRRGTSRTRTVYRVARVRANQDEGLARVRNISDGGMRLTIGMPVAAGDPIEVSMSDTLAFMGRVVWAENGECGVQFPEWIDSIAALRITAAEARSGTHRPPRLSASHPAVVVTDRGLRVTHLHDISQRGVKITHDGSFTKGLAVKIIVAPGIERSGYIRWVSNGLAGMMFTEPLTVEELGSVSAL